LVCVLALLLGLAGAAVEAADLDRYIERQMRKARVPGAATAIVVGDEVVQAQGYGWANPDRATPVTAATLFVLSSVSKTVTASVAMLLVDQRRLRMNTDVNSYLPFEVRNPSFPEQPITLRQLLTHTSSISDRGYYENVDEFRVAGDWPGSLTQFLVDYLTPGGRYYGADTSFRSEPPGTKAAYSNVGFALVGALVESVTGTSFETASQEELLLPLQMTESSWFLSNLDLDRLAVPCRWTGEGFEPYPYLSLAGHPAGMLRTSALQLANFVRLHLNRGRFEGRRILKKKTIKKMVRVQMPEVDPHRGLAFDLLESDGHRYAYHQGGFEGSTTELRLGLDEKIGVVVLTNGEAWGTRRQLRAFEKIRKRLFKEARRIAELEAN
jgi:CubicO group peptidase (beta-lactamase class C family)